MTTFKELGLIAPLQRALQESNYERPTEIQARTIPLGLDGRDILGCAQTGTGKTAAFALPILDYLSDQPQPASSGKPHALILVPTRELAIQIGQSLETYGRYLKLRTAIIFGGVKQTSQVRALQRGVDILVATPGRLLDLMQQGYIQLDRLEVFVLDEADRMLDMGFLPDLKRIIPRLPEKRQSLFFSATLSPEIVTLAKGLLYEPAIVSVTPKSRSVDKIVQHIRLVRPGEKEGLLKDILTEASVRLAIVFTRTKRGANKVEKKLLQQGVNAAAIHGNKSQACRERTLLSFRSGRVKVLVATDVAARGLDVEDVSHVINYDLPGDPESYVHRIGRTGRAGADGTAITFYTADQAQEMRAIERFAGVESSESPNRDEANSDSRRRRDSRPAAAGRGRKPAANSGGNRPHSNGVAPAGKLKSTQSRRRKNRSGQSRKPAGLQPA